MRSLVFGIYLHVTLNPRVEVAIADQEKENLNQEMAFPGFTGDVGYARLPAPGDQSVTGDAMFLEVTSGATQNRPTE